MQIRRPCGFSVRSFFVPPCNKCFDFGCGDCDIYSFPSIKTKHRAGGYLHDVHGCYVQPSVQPLANLVQKGYNIPDGAAMPLCRCALTFVGVQRLPPLYTAVVLL